MRRKYLPTGLTLLLLAATAGAGALQGAPSALPKIPVLETVLPNGMRLLMVERHDAPTVAGGWVAHVGSVNERPGITGISHLFEHMMFKGTHVIGTKDYEKDVEIIDEQDAIRDEMREGDVEAARAQRRGEIDDITNPRTRRRAHRSSKRSSTSCSGRAARQHGQERVRPIYTTQGASGSTPSPPRT